MKRHIQDLGPIPAPDHRQDNFRGIFESAPIGIYQSTIYRFLAGNPMLAKMFGYESPAEMTDRLEIPGELFVDIDEERAAMRDAIASDAAVHRQVEFLRKDGSTFFGALSLKAVRNDAGKSKFHRRLRGRLNQPQTGRGGKAENVIGLGTRRPGRNWLVTNGAGQ